MKYGKLMVVLCCLLFVAGCSCRYETYLMTKGEVGKEVSESTGSETSQSVEEQENEIELTRYILVDKLSGRMFYFNELQGELSVYDPEGK